MLKEICKKCITDALIHWGDTDEKEWVAGRVWCKNNQIISLKRIPPKDCPYALEHVVLSEERHHEERSL